MVRRGYSKFIKLIHFAGDVLLLNVTFLITYFFYNKINPLFSFNDHYVFLLIAFNLLWVIIVLVTHLYTIDRIINFSKITINLIKAVILHALLVLGFIFFIKGFYYSRGHLLLTYLISGFAIIMWRLSILYLLQAYRKSGSNYRNIVIVGAGTLGVSIYNYIKSDPALGFKFSGFFDDYPQGSKHKELVLGAVCDLKDYAAKERIDEIYFTLPLNNSYRVQEMMNFAENNLIRFKIIPDFRAFLDKRVSIEFYNSIPVLTVRKDPMENIFNLILKRTFDIVFSLAVICFIFPWLFPIVAILIKSSGRGPVFFKQKRSGRDNNEFTCYKFRTMYVNEGADILQASQHDARITSVGKYLRKFSIDELPQFFNVLLGEMTVVGPRPHMVKHTDDYSQVIDRFMVRHFVKPGITGWAQVKGYRGETENTDKMETRINYDLWYMENWTFFLDIKIIFMTVLVMFKDNKNAF